MRWRMMVAVVGLAVLSAPARADVRPHALCQDGMVLQQQAEVAIWGKADPGEEVTVTFRGQTVSAKTQADGEWKVSLKSGAAGGPEEMVLQGKNKLHYKNVLVGEVWVCSGQSNMEWSVGACDKTDKEYAFSAPHDGELRMFQVRKTPRPSPDKETGGSWVEADAKTIGPWTAVGYFFGRHLREKLKVPVGLIQSAWGGTRAEAWTSPEGLASHPAYKEEIERFLKMGVANPKARGANANAPSVLFNGMIHPLLNYRIKGAIWYQGESNATKAYAYRTLFPLMIEDWRKHWTEGDFSFYFVQLAPYQAVRPEPGESAWAELREAQLLTLKLANTGMAVITDFGNELDIHPTPKRQVGRRLALLALAKDYGKKVEYTGPTLKDIKIEGEKAILTFEHIDKGLEARKMEMVQETKKSKAWRIVPGTEAKLVGFAICGSDHKFHHAEARIKGDRVIVSSPQVSQPIAVRYGWADHPVCNLYNSAGLPASPFRTDDFPALTARRK